MHHGRLPWLTPDELSPEARDVYDAIVGGPRSRGPRLFDLTDPEGRLHGPFNAMLVAPSVGGPLQELGAAIRSATSLPDRCREIAILKVAAVRRSAFEWHAHAAVGRHVGVTDEELDALLEGREPASLDPTERLVLLVARVLLEDRDLDDATYREAEALLGPQLLMELVVLVGYYDLLALSLRVWRSPLPTGVRDPFAADGHAEAGADADVPGG